MAIQHRMDGAFGRDGNTREAAEDALSDFTNTPACVFALYVQDEVPHLKGKLMGVAIGAMHGGLGFPVNRLPRLSLHTTGPVVIHPCCDKPPLPSFQKCRPDNIRNQSTLGGL
jgi:hypothetical protein